MFIFCPGTLLVPYTVPFGWRQARIRAVEPVVVIGIGVELVVHGQVALSAFRPRYSKSAVMLS